jgi:signal transduction histidine kinase
LAIARNIARAQGGDLVLAANEPDRVCFSLILPLFNGKPRD